MCLYFLRIRRIKKINISSYTKNAYKIVQSFYMSTFISADAYKPIEQGDKVKIRLCGLCNRYYVAINDIEDLTNKNQVYSEKEAINQQKNLHYSQYEIQKQNSHE
jgi:hypothetical protein